MSHRPSKRSKSRTKSKSKSKSKAKSKSTKKYSKTKPSTKKSRNKSKQKPKPSKSTDIESSEEELVADKNGRFNCNECGKSYKQMSSLQRHIKKTHTMETTKCHQCQYCEASFFSKYQLTVHKFSNDIIIY